MEPAAEDGGGADDWRLQLRSEARQRVVDKIMDTLKRHLPITALEGINEVKKIAIRFEEKIYIAATSQSDYLRRISMKLISLGTKTQTPRMNSSPSNAGAGNQNTADSASSLGIESQVGHQGQSLSIPMASQSPVQQPLVPQNLQSNTASASLQGSVGMQAALPSISGLTQSTVSSVGQTSNPHNMPGISQNSINNPGGQCATPNIYANAQWQMEGRQQQQTIIPQQHQKQSQNPLMYQPALQQQLLKRKMPHSSFLQPHVQQQQQQQPLLPTQLQSSQQQPLMQMSSSLQTGQSTLQQTQPAISAIQSSIQQQSQHNSMQQSVTPLLQQHSQSTARQQHAQPTIHQQAASLQPKLTQISQQPMLLSQQQQLLGQQISVPDIQQQQQLLGQQTSVPDIQQQQLLPLGQQISVPDIQQQQQQRLPGQQNNLLGMQQPQQMLNQQNLSLHQQQQLDPQGKMLGMLQLPLQQQQLHNSQANVSNMQPLQRSMSILQQSKTAAQQQIEQPSMMMLRTQGQRSQYPSSQQRLMSQIQSQPEQLQQQMAMQQQTNSSQQEVQHRFQASNALLQSQTPFEQQKQFIQTQRGLPEISSSTPLDSTAQTGHAGVVDWQEEVYQKIKLMKELYFAELNEFNQKLTLKFQQYENLLPSAKQSEQYQKMKNFKVMLERSVAFLQISKNNIQPGLRDKLPIYEKQIIQFLTSNRGKKIAQPHVRQQFQQSGGNTLSMSQQQPSPVSQLQQDDNHVNQVQQMNLQTTRTSMQSAISSMPHGSVPVSQLSVATAQKNITNMMQPGLNLDQAQGSTFGSVKWGTINSAKCGGMGSLQNSVNAPQQPNISSLSQSSVSLLQPNVCLMQQGPDSLQQQNLKQQQQQQQQQQQLLLQSQQMKQQLQQCQIQQQLIQQHQKHQLLQQQPTLQQQFLQQKQQQATELPAHQMAQLNQMNEVNEMKLRQASGTKSALYQQHYPPGQRHNYFHPPVKESSFSISSPQNLQASSPQNSHYSSPQIDQRGLLASHPKAGTPLQNSPLVVPSPSTPVAPSPIPGDSEKQHSGISSSMNAVTSGHQQTTSVGPPQQQSLSVGTPGISASPLLAEFASPDGNQTNVPVTISSKSTATEGPMDRLIKVVQSISPKALNSSVSDIGSVASLIDRIAGSAPGNGSRPAVGEDLVAMTKCRLQARNFMSQDGSSRTKKMKHHIRAMPLNAVSSAGSMNENFKQSYGPDTSELESTATSSAKRQKVEFNHDLLEEIREINKRLVETVVSISDVDVDSIAAATAGREGIVVKFCFSAVACSPILKSHFASAQMSPIMPLWLLVPAIYPKCSPILLDELPVELSQEFGDLSSKAKSRFNISLHCLSQPMSLGDMARAWDVCAREVIAEYAQRMGGGTFSSRYGAWENCVSA